MIIPSETLTLKNGTQVLLRSPTEADSQDLLLLMYDCAHETNFLLRLPEEVDTNDADGERDWIRQNNEDPRSCVICAYIDGILAGNCGISPVNSLKKLNHRARLGIGIRQAFWGIGLGTAMLLYMEEMASMLGYEQLELDVFSSNKRALCLYEKLGFSETGFIPNAQKLPDGSYDNLIYMVKSLQ